MPPPLNLLKSPYICLNILISIVTDHYSNIKSKINYYDSLRKVEMLESIDLISNKFSTKKDVAGSPKYLFTITDEQGEYLDG